MSRRNNSIIGDSLAFAPPTNDQDGSCHIYAPSNMKIQHHAKSQFLNVLDAGANVQIARCVDYSANRDEVPRAVLCIKPSSRVVAKIV